MKTTSSEHVVYINCSECQNKNKKQFVHTTCSQHALTLQFSCNSMNNLLSYCGIVDARIIASEKDLTVQNSTATLLQFQSQHDRLCQEFQPQKTDDCLLLIIKLKV